MQSVQTAIKKVSALSTGTVKIHPEHIESSHKPLFWSIMTSNEWTAPRPINVYVIEHPQGLILFDAGQDIRSVTDDDYFPGGLTGLMYDKLAKFEIPPEESLLAQLKNLGYRPEDISHVILSHLHQDHIGGIRDLRQAEFIVSQREWNDMNKPFAELRGFLKRHIDLPGLNWQRIVFDRERAPIGPFEETLDVFKDDSMVLLPTPGHTPGSMSTYVRTDNGPLLLVGDLTYSVALLRQGKIPGVGSRKPFQQTTNTVRDLMEADPSLRVLPAHDPDAVGQLLKSA